MGWKLLGTLFSLAALSASGWPAAAQQAPLELRFDIADYRVEGNTLLSAADVARALAPYRGKRRDFGDVQRALEALEAAYRKAGYAAVRVFLPEQELEQGVVTLRVVEAKVGSVTVSGNKYFDDANVRRSVPAVREGTTPSAPRIADNTRLANENPAKQTQVVLRPASRPNEVDAVIEVEDSKPWRAFLTADNTGTPDTGMYRVGLGFQHNNLFNRDHTITGQYITSATEPDQVSIYSIGYRLPIYSLGDSIDLIAGYSDVDAGTTQTQAGPLAFTGQGYVALARYNLLLPRRAEYEHRVVFGLDYRQYQNACEFSTIGSPGCGPAGEDYVVRPLSVAYSGALTQARSQLSLYANLAQNIPSGGGESGEAALDAARPGAQAWYTILRAGVSFAYAFWRDFQTRLRLDGQYTGDALVAGEQFGIGGWNSVRGFYERQIAGDTGYSGSAELYTPNLLPKLGAKSGELRLLAFYDFGKVHDNDIPPGTPDKDWISSAGAGLRFSLRKNVFLRADAAYLIDGGGLQENGDVRGNVGLLLSY
jgi:hemolysin activation/secretion protein